MEKFNGNENKVRSMCHFTTHTPVEAGHDHFSLERCSRLLYTLLPDTLQLPSWVQDNRLHMTELGLHFSCSANGVSKLHGKIAQDQFPENKIIPSDASHILVYTQKKFWFQDDAERRLKGPIANVSIMDPEGSKKKEKVLGNIKEGLKNFSLSKYKKQGEVSEEKTGNLESDSKAGGEKGKKFRKGSEWRISEYRGLGLGISLAGLNGIVTFYDYNLDYDLQLHYSLELTGPQVNSAFKALRLTEESTEMQSIAASGSGNTLEINRSLFSATLRWFVDESVLWGILDGFYYGAGGGLGYATLKYQGKDTAAVATISGEKETYDSIATEYNHSTIGYGLFAVLDAGWQGHENYYFQFSLQPSFYIVYQDGYEETSIPENPNQRSAVTDRWTRAKDLTRVLLGFGIFF